MVPNRLNFWNRRDFFLFLSEFTDVGDSMRVVGIFLNDSLFVDYLSDYL